MTQPNRKARLRALSRFEHGMAEINKEHPVAVGTDLTRAINAVAQAHARKLHPDVVWACEQHLASLRNRGDVLPGLPRS